MARHFGGKKRAYKIKGRLSARKAYQLHCREQYKQGLVPYASGRFGALGAGIPQSIAKVYEAFFQRLG